MRGMYPRSKSRLHRMYMPSSTAAGVFVCSPLPSELCRSLVSSVLYSPLASAAQPAQAPSTTADGAPPAVPERWLRGPPTAEVVLLNHEQEPSGANPLPAVEYHQTTRLKIRDAKYRRSCKCKCRCRCK